MIKLLRICFYFYVNFELSKIIFVLNALNKVSQLESCQILRVNFSVKKGELHTIYLS